MNPQAPTPENQNSPNNTVPAPEPAPIAPRGDDELFRSANNGMELDEGPVPQPLPVKKSRKKPLLVVLTLLVLITGAAAAWYFLIREANTDTARDLPAPAASEKVEPTYEPNTIAYAFRDKQSDPVTIFTRPAEGGDRKEIQKLTRDSGISQTDTSGKTVAFVDDNDIYISTDHGATYTRVFEGEAGAQITSLVIDTDDSGVAFGYLKEVAGKNEIRTLDYTGKNPKTLFTNTQPGVLLSGWSSKKQQVIYRSGCYNCDGGTFLPYVLNTATSKATRILEDVDPKAIVSFATSADTSRVIYVKGVMSEDPGFESAVVAPYEVKVLDVKKNESTDIASVGKAGEKNPNGTLIYRSFQTGFTAGTNTPYYATGKQLFLVRNDEGLLFYEADKDILELFHVSDNHVIASTGEFGEYLLSNYDVKAKKSTSILQGDENTTIFGVTTD